MIGRRRRAGSWPAPRRALAVVVMIGYGAAAGCFQDLDALAPFPCAQDSSCPDGFACAPAGTSNACVACGAHGKPCCAGDTCTGNLQCASGACSTCVPSCGSTCGGAPDGCGGTCDGACPGGTVCGGTACVACGASGQPCCSGHGCTQPLQCSKGTCDPCLAKVTNLITGCATTGTGCDYLGVNVTVALNGAPDVVCVAYTDTGFEMEFDPATSDGVAKMKMELCPPDPVLAGSIVVACACNGSKGAVPGSASDLFKGKYDPSQVIFYALVPGPTSCTPCGSGC